MRFLPISCSFGGRDSFFAERKCTPVNGYSGLSCASRCEFSGVCVGGAVEIWAEKKIGLLIRMKNVTFSIKKKKNRSQFNI